MPRNKQDPLYQSILNIDALSMVQVMPPISPLQISFTAVGRKRDKLLNNFSHCRIDSKSRVIKGAGEATVTFAFDDVSTYAAAAKIGNSCISSTDAIFKFKGAAILMAKTLITKQTEFLVEGRISESREITEYKLKVLKCLNLAPFLNRVSEYNLELGAINAHNILRKEARQPLLQEPTPPPTTTKTSISTQITTAAKIYS